MRKYIIIGLVILIGSNILALSGVVYNRMGEPKAQFRFSERELYVSGNRAAREENSGVSLRLKWRTPQEETAEYYFNHHEIASSREALELLGFKDLDEANNYNAESLELYWAMEFNGQLYFNEVAKAQKLYSNAKLELASQNDTGETNEQKDAKHIRNSHQEDKLKRLSRRVNEAKYVDSRLFFLDASADYDTLLKKYENHDNVLIAKGIAKPFLDGQNNQYRLVLQRLLCEEIMVSTDHSDQLKNLAPRANKALRKPRFEATIAWGKKLEPWLINIEKIAIQSSKHNDEEKSAVTLELEGE